MNIYWGDLHNHCGISYGFGSLENALAAAKEHLDFCSVTGHAMWPDIYERCPETEFVVDFHHKGFQKLRDHWEEVRETVAKSNSEDFVTFQGYEMHSCYYGDYHLVSPCDQLPLIERESPEQLVKDCGCEAIAVPHHIGYTPGYRGINWAEFREEISPVVEVCSKHGCSMSERAPFPYYHDMGPRDSHNTVEEGLRSGRHFSFVGSTDHHAGYPGSYGDGLVAVLAEEKTRDSIWKALKAGRTYAVTGDRILCDFRINGCPSGSYVEGNSRKISCDISAEYWIDKVILYKNLKPVKIWNGEEFLANPNSGRYKIRIELGWGDSDELYHWDNQVFVKNGKVTGQNFYFRGRSVLSPTNKEESRFDQINRIENRVVSRDESHVHWICETAKNKSTLHPQTDSAVIEVEGSPETEITFLINEKQHTKTIGELLQYGFSEHQKPWHSQAYKVHTAVPDSSYQVHLEFTDEQKEREEDIYYMEISQKNGQYAFLSPIYVR
ncbi:MAG: DUF3604 domain-containing protein [Fusicatenibacter sp.]|nr:DUF3604 domain-containing protein [Lachnospiraceae bacterium]MDY2938714.1 DUF3604 domain-containing protein [Fusicatenibacter sp.]